MHAIVNKNMLRTHQTWLLTITTFAYISHSGGSHYHKAATLDGSSDSILYRNLNFQYQDRPQASATSSDNNSKRLWLIVPGLLVFSLLCYTCKIGCCVEDDDTLHEEAIIHPYNMLDNSQVTTREQLTYSQVHGGQVFHSYPMDTVSSATCARSLGHPIRTGNAQHVPHSDLVLSPFSLQYSEPFECK